MVTSILSIIFGILAIFFAVIIFYSLKRITRYETILLNISDKTDFINHQLKKIDHKGTFESDDEVGFFFREVKELNSILNNLFEQEVKDGASQNQEKKKKEE